jgi:hypothetical protein
VKRNPRASYPEAPPIPLGDDLTSGLSAGEHSNPAPEPSIARVIG